MGKDARFDSPQSVNPLTDFERVSSDRLNITRLTNQTGYDPLNRIFRSGTWTINFGNYLSLSDMQKNTFGALTPSGEFDQLIRQGKGIMYFAESKEKPGTTIGYVVLQTKNLDEAAIQVEMTQKATAGDNPSGLDRYNGQHTFHDHLDYPLAPNTVLIAELGILQEYQKQGLGLELLQSIMEAQMAEHGNICFTAFVRINNLGPQKVDTKLNFGVKNNLLLGSMSMIGMQGPTRDRFGSVESNFRADSIVPAIAVLPLDCSSSRVWRDGDQKPSGKYFFLPMSQGEQADLKNSVPMIEMLKTVMAYGRIPVEGEDFIMRKVCEYDELKELGITDITPGVSYLFFTKDWKYGIE